MKLNIPLPFYYVQSDVKLRKEKEFNDLEFLLIMMFYSLSNGEISKQNSLRDSIKNFLNLGDNFFEFIKKELLINLIENDVIIYEKSINEISENDMIGYYSLNNIIKKNIDNNIFKGFESNTRESSYYIYKNLITIENWQTVNKKIKNESDFKDEKKYFLFKPEEIEKNYKEQIINSINSYVDKNESGYKPSNINLISQESKIVLLDCEINLEHKNKIIYPLQNSDLETLENLCELGYQDYIKNWFSKTLLMNNEFDENKYLKLEINPSHSFSEFDFYEIEKIREMKYFINSLFPKSTFNYIIFNEKIYLYKKTSEIALLNISEDKKIEINISFLNLFNFDEVYKNEIINKIIHELDWNSLLKNINNIPEIFKTFCCLAAKQILQNNRIFDENSFSQIISFLSKINIDYKDFEKITLNNHFFQNENFPKFINELFKYDSENKRKFENEFKEFEIKDEIQKKLNDFYKFDYSKKDSYFKVSAEEKRFQKMKSFINENKNIDNSKIEQIKNEWNQIIKSFYWLNHEKISNIFDEKIRKSTLEMVEKTKDEISLKAANMRLLLENKIALYSEIGQDEVNKNFKTILKWLKSSNKINESEFETLFEAKQICNKFLHFNSESSSLEINNLIKNLKDLNSKEEEIKKIIDKWGV